MYLCDKVDFKQYRSERQTKNDFLLCIIWFSIIVSKVSSAFVRSIFHLFHAEIDWMLKNSLLETSAVSEISK